MFNQIKKGLIAATKIPALRPLYAYFYSKTLNIVFTHYIGSSPPPHYKCFMPQQTDTSNFFEDIDELSCRFSFTSLPNIFKCTVRTKIQQKPIMALTIDDGFDIYSDELIAQFKKRKIRPYIFLITKYIGNSDLMWRHKLSAIISMTSNNKLKLAIKKTWPNPNQENFPPIPMNAIELLRASLYLPRETIDEFARELWNSCDLLPLNEYTQKYTPYLTWERIKYLRDEGFQFGSHSHSHPCFDLLSTKEALSEMQISHNILVDNLGDERYLFAYPYGRLPKPEFRCEIEANGGYNGYLGTFGFSKMNNDKPSLSHRISIEEGIEPLSLAPIYSLLRSHPLLTRSRRTRV